MTNSYPFTVFGDEFKSKRVLVTGGTKGVGEAIARRFELSGALVATTARSEAAQGQHPALFIQAELGTARRLQTDIECITRTRRWSCGWSKNVLVLGKQAAAAEIDTVHS